MFWKPKSEHQLSVQEWEKWEVLSDRIQGRFQRFHISGGCAELQDGSVLAWTTLRLHRGRLLPELLSFIFIRQDMCVKWCFRSSVISYSCIGRTSKWRQTATKSQCRASEITVRSTRETTPIVPLHCLHFPLIIQLLHLFNLFPFIWQSLQVVKPITSMN